jgi:hypothetical protein
VLLREDLLRFQIQSQIFQKFFMSQENIQHSFLHCGKLSMFIGSKNVNYKLLHIIVLVPDPALLLRVADPDPDPDPNKLLANFFYGKWLADLYSKKYIRESKS